MHGGFDVIMCRPMYVVMHVHLTVNDSIFLYVCVYIGDVKDFRLSEQVDKK